MIIDCWMLLDKDRRIQSLNWNNTQLEKLYADEWRSYLGRPLKEIQELQVDENLYQVSWRGEKFSAMLLETPENFQLLLLKKEDLREKLFEAAMDKILHGIQIYDREANLVYLNKTSRTISGIPSHMDVTGKHLTDLYDLEEEISTIMTTLRTASPVINRFDIFKTTDGSTISSINTGYPIFDNKELIGAVAFDQNLESITAQIAKQEEIKEVIKRKTSLPPKKFSGYHFSDLIGSNDEFISSVNLAKKVSPQNCSILLVGETGTGKEIFAQSIHKASDRHRKKFVAINCAAVPEPLIESVFFGTSKGSFTGSVEKAGLLEEASGGTLFLDELNSMSLSMQSKLLRVIQEGSFRRVGGSRDIQCDIRFISSCNDDPTVLLARHSLRKDLYYRLSTVTIDIPPLRRRMDDISELVHFYLGKRMGDYAKFIGGISQEALACFGRYDWPGNIRELFNVLDFALNTMEGETVEPRHLPKSFQPDFKIQERLPIMFGGDTVDHESKNHKAPPKSGPGDDLGKKMLLAEKNHIEEALLACRYNVTKAARYLGLSRQSLQYRIKKCGLDR